MKFKTVYRKKKQKREKEVSNGAGMRWEVTGLPGGVPAMGLQDGVPAMGLSGGVTFEKRKIRRRSE